MRHLLTDKQNCQLTIVNSIKNKVIAYMKGYTRYILAFFFVFSFKILKVDWPFVSIEMHYCCCSPNWTFEQLF